MLRAVPILFLLLMASAVSSLAQETTGNLQGRILDPSGAPVSLVQITVAGTHLQGERSTISSSKGYFHFLALPIGSYTVKISHISYHPIVLERIQVGLGRTTDIGAMSLEARLYETEAIEVVAEAPMLDPISTVLGANLRAEEYEDLPIDRNYRNMLTLLPHVNESYLGDEVGFTGGTGQENKYYVDGADGTDIIFGMRSTELPYNFIREIQVRSGGYQAEYRSSLGGIVEVITNSGSNDFHGQVFGYYLNDRMTAEQRQTVDEPFAGSYAMYDAGFGIGGPIKRDRLWFYLAYNPTFSNEEAELPGLGIYDYDGTTHRFASKLTWRIDPKNDLELSIYGDPSRWEGATAVSWMGPIENYENSDAALQKQEGGTVNVLLSGKHRVRDNVLLESRISAVSQLNTQFPLTEKGSEPLYFDHGTNAVSGGTLYDCDMNVLVTTFGLNGTVIRGDHLIKGGLEYRDIKVDYYDKAEAIDYYPPDQWSHLIMKTDGIVHNRIPSAFLQDSWQVRDRLNLNLGIRWDGQYIFDSDGEIAVRFTDQWQPRAGFTCRVDENGRQQVFGSYGRYYQELSMAAPAMTFIYGSTYRITLFDHDPRLDPAVGPGDTVIVDDVSESQGELTGLDGQHFDEFTLGYERQLTQNSKVTLRGIYRTLRNGLEDVLSESTGDYIWGNPGYGELSDFPKMKREYTAAELTYQHSRGGRYAILASYTLSRTRGNYAGIFDLTNRGGGWPNAMPAYDALESLENGDGLLPNDRTHSIKLAGSWLIGYGLTIGGTALWQSGTPLNEFGASLWGLPYTVFVVPRGEAGRMNSIWDLSLRLTYDLSEWWEASIQPKILLDLLHIGSPREAVDYVQLRYLERDEDGNHITENPLYGRAIMYQPPFAVRAGITIDF